jgi:hypothetical protein
MAKRKREPVALAELDSLGLDEFTTKLKERGGRDLVAKVTLAIAHLGGLTATDLQTFSETVPSFSKKARWDRVAPKFGLDVSRDIYQLETFSVPCLSLPPSFHRQVMRNSAQWLDVYQEAGSHSREAARMRLMDAVCFMRFLSTTWLNISSSGLCLFALYLRVVLSIDQGTPCPIHRKIQEARSSIKST